MAKAASKKADPKPAATKAAKGKTNSSKKRIWKSPNEQK